MNAKASKRTTHVIQPPSPAPRRMTSCPDPSTMRVPSTLKKLEADMVIPAQVEPRLSESVAARSKWRTVVGQPLLLLRYIQTDIYTMYHALHSGHCGHE